MATSLKKISTFSPINLSAELFSFGIVTAQWNSDVTHLLYQGAYQALEAHQALPQNIHAIEVPGSYELIAGANLLLNSYDNLDAIICLGCIIQGETRHFEFICQAVADGLMHVTLKYNKPVIFGVLTTDDLDQALDRAGGKHGNKGEEAAFAALQMISVQKKLNQW